MFYRPAANRTRVTLRAVDVITEPDFAFRNEQTLPIEGFIAVPDHLDYDITPDGDRLVMVFPADQADPGATTTPQINVVLNWFQKLTERVPVP